MNLVLAFTMAVKSLNHHRIVAAVTIAGVAIGMGVISTIVVVDHATLASERKKAAKRSRIERVADPSLPQID